MDALRLFLEWSVITKESANHLQLCLSSLVSTPSAHAPPSGKVDRMIL